MKWPNLIYEATFGILNEYKDVSLDIAKVQAARYYLQFVKILRKQSLYYVLTVLAVLAVANLLLVGQIAVLLYGPMDVKIKVLYAVGIGVLGSALMLWIILQVFSQRRWMKFTGADALLDAVR